jgi:hypothetical protein
MAKKSTRTSSSKYSIDDMLQMQSKNEIGAKVQMSRVQGAGEKPPSEEKTLRVPGFAAYGVKMLALVFGVSYDKLAFFMQTSGEMRESCKELYETLKHLCRYFNLEEAFSSGDQDKVFKCCLLISITHKTRILVVMGFLSNLLNRIVLELQTLYPPVQTQDTSSFWEDEIEIVPEQGPQELYSSKKIQEDRRSG